MIKKRYSRQRQLILDAVMNRCDHPTADQIYMDVRTKDPRVSRGTVYRNLGVLAQDGDIMSIKLSTADRFDGRVQPHHHMVCTGCSSVVDVPLAYDEAMDAQVAQDSGFQVSRHVIIFEGLCAHCSQA